MRILYLAQKDLKQLTQDRRTAFFLLLMPVLFTILFGFMFGGFNAGEEDPRMPLALINQDESSGAEWMVAYLEGSEVVRPVQEEGTSVEEWQQQVADEDIAGLLIVPEGFGQELLNGNKRPLELTVSPGGLNSESIKQEVSVPVSRLRSAALTASLSAEAFERQEAFGGESDRMEYVEAAFQKALDAWQDPPIQTNSTMPKTASNSAEGELDYDNAFIHSSPAMILQFAIAGLMGAAEIIVTERKSRSLQRMLTTAISRAGILLGHFLAMFTMLFAQIVVLIVFGQLVLRLDYTQAIPATFLISVCVALCVAALGLLIGALAKNQEHVPVFSLIPMFVLAGIGGAWVPLEFTSDTVQMVGHFSPVAWGMDGYKNILARGLGLEAAWLPAGMLVLFAAVFFGLAVWRFKFE